MLLVLGTVRMPVEKLNEARQAMQAMIEASRQEDGCEAYSYAEDVLVPGLIRVHEVWRDRTALDRHFETAHLREWREQWPALGIHARDLHLYEAGTAQQI